MIGFSQTERKVFQKITRNPQSVADIVRKTKLPRMTVHITLIRLQKKKVVTHENSSSGKRVLWLRNKDSLIEDVVAKTESFLFHDKITRSPNKKSPEVDLVIGKKDIADTLMYLTTRKDGAQMYSIQNSNNWKKWVTVMGKDWVNKHNQAVVDHKLVAFTIHSLQAPVDIKGDKEILKAYKGRRGNSHAIPETFLKKDLCFYIFESTIFLVNLEKLEAVLFENEDMASFLVKMFSFMFEKSETEEFFLKYGR